MGFTLDDLTPKRPATAATHITDFPSDNVGQPDETPVQNTATEPVKNTAIDTTGITGNGGHESFAEQPTEDVTKVTPNTGITIDWSRPYAEIEQNPILQQMKPYDIMRDYQKNGDGNWSVFMPWLNTLGDGDKTVAANEALKKKAERQAKMEQWSNFLMHLGNFIGTTQGAPSQKIESAQELTDRQRKIREATEALRAKGYNQMMVNIYKDRQDKQAQMQAEAAAKANEALAAYRGSQKNQTDALTPVKVQTEKERGNAAAAAQAALSTSKKNTEDALRGKKGKLLDAQTNNANAGAADHNASVNVKGAQVRHINSQTEGQNQRNANQKESDDFNTRYVNDPVFKKHVNEWAKNNGMAIGGNDGRGGTWANEKNRQQASRWAKAKMKLDRTPPSRRGRGGSKVPPSRRGGSKVPPSRRRK